MNQEATAAIDVSEDPGRTEGGGVGMWKGHRPRRWMPFRGITQLTSMRFTFSRGQKPQ